MNYETADDYALRRAREALERRARIAARVGLDEQGRDPDGKFGSGGGGGGAKPSKEVHRTMRDFHHDAMLKSQQEKTAHEIGGNKAGAEKASGDYLYHLDRRDYHHSQI